MSQEKEQENKSEQEEEDTPAEKEHWLLSMEGSRFVPQSVLTKFLQRVPRQSPVLLQELKKSDESD